MILLPAHHALILDDIEFIPLIISKMLSRHGITSVRCSDEAHAWQVLHNEPITLLIEDFRRPGLGGVDFILEMRRYNEFRNLPAIMITGQDRSVVAAAFAQRRRRLESELAAFLNKPFEITDLLDTVSRVPLIAF